MNPLDDTPFCISDAIIRDATELRHQLHRFPELSNQEHKTAAHIAKMLSPLHPARLLTELGGIGVAAEFGTGSRCLLIRCELDALPIQETGLPDYRSMIDGVGHLCGHDGHMAIVYAVARSLAKRPPDCRVVLLFQPAEETGDGARDVLGDPRFAELQADLAIAIHNLPKIPLGSVLLAEGPVTCASRGLKILLNGRTSHSSQPQNGRSPAEAMSVLVPALAVLGNQLPTADPGFRLATVTHVQLGVPNFGVSPGHGEIWVTLRTLLNDDLDELETEARALVSAHASEFEPRFSVHERFSHGVNDIDATELLQNASAHLPAAERSLPMRFSEDFGLFGTKMPAALLFLGSGVDQPELHNPDFDFPDELIAVGAELFLRAIHSFGASAN